MRFRPQPADRGATIITVVIMMVAMLGAAAFAVDLGIAYSVKRQLSTTADASSLAGAQSAALNYVADGGCVSSGSDWVASSELQKTIEDAVTKTHQQNDPRGSTVPTVANGRVTIDCLSGGTAVIGVDVTVDEQSDLPTIFGNILGVGALRPAGTATATASSQYSAFGLRPLIMCQDELVAAVAERQAAITALVDSGMKPAEADRLAQSKTHQSNYGYAPSNGDAAECNSATPGNWYYWDAKMKSTVIWCLLEYGYGNENCNSGEPDFTGIQDPTTAIEGNKLTDSTKDKEALDAAMADSPFAVPVGTDFIGGGATAQYTADGIASIMMCAYAFPPKGKVTVPPSPPSAGDIYADTNNCPATAANVEGFDESVYKTAMTKPDGESRKNVSLVVQWRLVRHEPDPGTSFLGESCEMGSINCPTYIYLTK